MNKVSMQQSPIKTYLQPAFLICAAILALAGISMSKAIKKFGIYMQKEPLPLRKSLDLLDENGLGPYKVIAKPIIENQEIVKTLGTTDYIQWVMEDTEVPFESPVKRVMLFITYYPLADRVPHVPEECYTGGGYQRMGTDNIKFTIKNEPTKQFTGKYLVFSKTSDNFWQSHSKFPVVYFFKVNGQYAGDREEARIALNKNLFKKSSYFCKVEMAFNQTLVAPNQEETASACQKLLNVILPILEDEHWPIWEN